MRKILVLLILFQAFVLQAQIAATITPGSNPSAVVRLGDPVEFPVEIYNTSSSEVIPSGSIFTIKAPANWKIVSATPSLGSINAAKDSASITLSGAIAAGGNSSITVKMQPLCAAEPEEGVASYRLLAAAGGSPTYTTAATPVIGNFKDVTLFVTNESREVSLNRPTTRVFSIEQTAIEAYTKSLKIEAAYEKKVIVISKIEISKDSIGWTDVTAAVTSLTDKYIYTLDQSTLGSLGYAGSSFKKGDILYVRETVELKQCGYGNTNYSFYCGDGTNFCNSNATKTSTLSVYAPSYIPDIENFKKGIAPTSSTNNGILFFCISNKSTQAAADMRDILVQVYNNDLSRFIYKKAYFVDDNGVKVSGLPEIPLQGNRAITQTNVVTGLGTTVIDAHAKKWLVSFDKLSTDAQYTADYQTAGLSSLDGDGIYNDIESGKKVYIAVEWNFDFSMVNCSQQLYGSVTRKGDLYYKNSCDDYIKYARDYATTVLEPGTTNAHLGYGYFTPGTVSVSPANLTKNMSALLTLSEGNGFGVADGPLPDGTSWTELTLPEGFAYDPTQGIKQKGTVIDPADITILAPGKIRFKVIPNTGESTKYYIGVTFIADGSVSSKSVHIQHNWGFPSEPEVTFGCYDLNLNYEQIVPCGNFQMTSFDAERTTFGYTDYTMGTKVDRNTPGINLNVAGPYDNVDFKATINIGENISLTGNQKILAAITYEGAASAADYYFDKSRGAVLKGTINGVTNTTITIPASAITYSYSTTGGKHLHSLTSDLTDYISTLKSGDAFEVILQTQTKGNLPNILTQLPYLIMQVYMQEQGIDPTPSCNKLTNNFSLIDYKRTTWGTGSAGTYHLNQHSLAAVAYTWSNSAVFPIVFFPNEFRPNQLHSNIVFETNSLVKIHGAQGYSAKRTPLTYSMNYTVSYDGCKTIVSLTDPLKAGANSDDYLYQIYLDMEYIQYSGKDAKLTMNTVYYPTSEQPQSDNDQVISYTLQRIINDYKYALTTVAPTIEPTSNRGEWTLRVVNQSYWAATDGALPNSWIAVEVPTGGVTPLELWDVATNAKVSGSFVSYGTNKWWFKLGNILVNEFKEYKLVCSYSECSNAVDVNVLYGMSRVAYPDDPEKGYLSQYKSGMCKAPTTLALKLTPPASNFSVQIESTPNMGGKYDFCSPIPFKVQFANGLDSELSQMEVRINLPMGMSYQSFNSTTVTIGNGTPQSIPANRITQSGQIVTISLPESIVAESYVTEDANPKAHVYVDFNLKAECGFASGSSVYMTMKAQNGCGKQIYKLVNSHQIKIDNLVVAAPIMSIDNTATTIVNGQSQITLAATYKLLAAGTSNMYAIIELPANMELVSSAGDLAFEQTGTRLLGKFDDNATAGSTYTFSVLVKAINPNSWVCGEYTIDMKYGVVTTMNCGGNDCDIYITGDNSEAVKFKTDSGLAPTWTTTAESLDRTVTSGDIDALANAQALIPTATSTWGWTLTPVKTTGTFVSGGVGILGTYTNTWLVQDMCDNGSSAFTQVIRVVNGATLTVSSDVEICKDETTTLTASGALSYVWTPTAGLSATTGASVEAFPSVTTTYTVVGTDAFGNTDSMAIVVTVNPLPNAGTITGTSGTIRVNESKQLIASVTGGSWSSSVPTVASITSAGGVSGLATGTTEISYTVQNASGCRDTVKITLKVNPAQNPIPEPTPNPEPTPEPTPNPEPTPELGKPEAGINLESSQIICAGEQTITILGEVVYTKGKMQYSILFSDEVNAVGILDKTTYQDLTGNSFSFTIPVNTPSGIYKGTLVIKGDENSNLITDYPFEFEVLAGAKITKQPQPISNICDNSNFTLAVQATGDGLAYQWYLNDKLIPGANTETYQAIFSAQTEGVYHVEVIGTCGVAYSDKVTVSGGALRILIKWDDVLYIMNTDHRYVSFQWYKDNVAINPYGTAVFYTDEKNGLNGTYKVRAYKTDGTFDESCSMHFATTTKSTSVFVYPNPVLRNASVSVVISEIGESATQGVIEIYDMAGRKVYAGRTNGINTQITMDVPTGSYIVHITLESGKVVTQKLIVK